jgi:hypothetical protein
MPQYIDAYGFITGKRRHALFWLSLGCLCQGKIANDFPRIIAAFFGVAFNMLTFLKGLSLTSPISASVIMVTTPMIVLILSAIIHKERMRNAWSRYYLRTNGHGISYYIYRSVGSTNANIGNILVLINAVSYGFI